MEDYYLSFTVLLIRIDGKGIESVSPEQLPAAHIDYIRWKGNPIIKLGISVHILIVIKCKRRERVLELNFHIIILNDLYMEFTIRGKGQQPGDSRQVRHSSFADKSFSGNIDLCTLNPIYIHGRNLCRSCDC